MKAKRMVDRGANGVGQPGRPFRVKRFTLEDLCEELGEGWPAPRASSYAGNEDTRSQSELVGTSVFGEGFESLAPNTWSLDLRGTPPEWSRISHCYSTIGVDLNGTYASRRPGVDAQRHTCRSSRAGCAQPKE